jgi:hypothetical protein
MASSNRARQLRTNLAVQSRTASASAEAIATGIFISISRNLEEYGFNKSCLRLHNFRWLLPKSGSTEQQLSIFHALHDCPMAVPNDDLVRILELELCTKTSPSTPPGTHFYIHSLKLTRHQLEQVMEFMAEQGVMLSKAVQEEIISNLHNNQTQSCTFTIRYFGKVSGPGRPIDRHIRDLAADMRQSGILLEFIAAVEQLFPEVAAAAQVHLIKQASVDDGFGARIIIMDIESVLIEFFDPQSLFHRAQGGSYISWIPYLDDITLFERLKTRYYSQFLAQARLIATDPQMTIALLKHFAEIQESANYESADTGTVQHHFTNQIRETMRMSAEPMLYRGRTILVVLAKETTYEQYLGNTTFFESSARAGDLVHDFLSRLARAEESNAGGFWSSRAFHPRHIAVYHFWPWLWHSHTTLFDATIFAKEYLDIVHPLVVVTLSQSVTSIVRANFEIENAMPFETGLSSLVGEITIQYYGYEGSEHSAFLSTPQIDPSIAKYADHKLSEVVLRFMDLSWQMTLHLADEARKLLDQDHADGITRSRKAQCIEILRRINHLRATDHDMREFMDNFQRVGNDLRIQWRELHHFPEFEDFQPISNENCQAEICDDDYDDDEDSEDDKN